MHEIISKIKNFFMGNYKTMFIIGGIVVMCFLAWYVFSERENISSNGVSTDNIRNELNRVEGTKQDIANTASDIKNTSTKLENAIGTASETSSNFESIIDQCQSIIEQIRKQSAE